MPKLIKSTTNSVYQQVLKIKYEIQELRTSLKAFAIKKKNIIQHNRKANNLLIFLFQFLMIQDNVKTCNRHQNQDSLLICLRQECLDKDLMCQKCLDEGKHNTCFQTDKVIQLKSLQNIIIGKNQRVKDHLQELEQIQKQLNLQIESICQYLINNIQTRLENYMNFVKQLYSNSEQFIANMGENYFNEKLLKFSRDSWLFEIQKDSLQVIQDVLNQFENLLPENLSKTKEQIQFSTYFVTPQEQRIDIKLHQNKYQVPIKSSIKEIAISQDSNYIFLYLENKESQILSQQNTKIIHRWQNDQIITFAAFSLNNRDLFLGTSTGTIQKFVVTENYCDKTWNLKCNADSQITQIIQLNSDMLLTESNFDFFQINDLNSQKKLLWKYQKKKKISSNIIMTSLSQILIFQDDLNILFFDTNFMNLSLSMKLENIKEHKIFLMKYQPYDMDEYLLLLENNNRIKIYSFNKDLKSIIQVQNVNLHVSIEKIFYIKSKDILVLFQAKSVILSKVTVDEFKIIREIKDLQYDFNILKKSDNFIGILMKNKQKINKKLLKQSQQIIFDGQYQNEETVKYQNALKKLIPFINHEKVENVDDHLWAFRSTILGNVSIMEQNLESFSRYVETIKSFQDHAQRLIEYLDKFIKQQNEYFKVQISKQKDLIQLIEKNSLNSINIEEGIEHLKYEPLKDASFCEIMEIFDLVCEKLENICYYTQAQYDKYCKKGDQHHFTEHTLPTFRPQQTFTIESYDYWPIAAVSISKDETLLATTAYDDYLKIWNLKENKMVTEVNLNEEALHVCFSNCQNYVYLGLSDGKVKKLQFMKNEQTLYQIHDPKLYLSENKIATSSIDYTIRITQLQEIDKQIKIKTRTVDQSNIEYSQKNNFLLSIDRVDLCLWDADSGIELLRYKKVFPYDGITQTYLSPSESRIASICEFEQGVRLFRFIYDQKLVELEHIHYFLRSQVYNISWGLDDNTLVCTYNEYFYVAQLDCEKKMKKLQLQDNILDQQYLIQLFITPTFNYLLGLKKRNLIYKNEYQQNHGRHFFTRLSTIIGELFIDYQLGGEIWQTNSFSAIQMPHIRLSNYLIKNIIFHILSILGLIIAFFLCYDIVDLKKQIVKSFYVTIVNYNDFANCLGIIEYLKIGKFIYTYKKINLFKTVKYQNALKKLIPFINHEKVENVDDHLWAFRSTILGNVSIMEQNLESFSRYVETIKSFQDHAQRLIEYLDKFIKQQNEYFKVQISKQKDLIQLIEKNSLNSINIEEGIEHLKYEPLKDASFCEIMEIFDLVCEKLENICYYTQAQYDKYCKKGDQHHFTEHTLPTFRPQQTFTIESYDYWPIAAVSISKDETLLATTAYDDYLKIWNLKENKMVTEVNLNEEALHVCFSNCQNYVYLGLSDGKVKKLQFMKNEQTLYQIHDPKLYLSENKIATSSIDYTIRITQLQEIDKQIKIKTRTVDQSNIEYSQKNNFLLSIDRVDLCLWDADSGIELLRYKKVFPYDGITQTYLSPSESRIASICEFEQGVRLFRFIYDQKLVELEHIHYFLRSQVYNISWGLDDNTLVQENEKTLTLGQHFRSFPSSKVDSHIQLPIRTEEELMVIELIELIEIIDSIQTLTGQIKMNILQIFQNKQTDNNQTNQNHMFIMKFKKNVFNLMNNSKMTQFIDGSLVKEQYNDNTQYISIWEIISAIMIYKQSINKKISGIANFLQNFSKKNYFYLNQSTPCCLEYKMNYLKYNEIQNNDIRQETFETTSKYQNALKKLMPIINFENADWDDSDLLWGFKCSLKQTLLEMEFNLESFSRLVKEIQNLKGYAEQMIGYLERFILQQNEYLNDQIARQKVIIETIEKNALSYIHIEEGIKILSFKPLKDRDFCDIMRNFDKVCEQLENLCIKTESQYEFYCQNGYQHYFQEHKIITYRQKKNFTIESNDYVGSQPIIHECQITAVSISQDGSLLATTAYDDFLKIWNLEEHKMVTEVNLNEQALSVCFSNCQNYVYLGLSDGQVKRLQIRNNQLTEYQIHTRGLYVHFIMEISEDRIVTFSIDNTFRITQLNQIEQQLVIKTQTVDKTNVEYSMKDKFILSIDCLDLCLWDSETGQELMRKKYIFPKDGRTQTYLSPSESRIASICEFEEGIRLFRFNFEQKQLELEQICNFMGRQIFNISWGLDDNTLLCCYESYFFITQLDQQKKRKQLQALDNQIDEQLLIFIYEVDFNIQLHIWTIEETSDSIQILARGKMNIITYNYKKNEQIINKFFLCCRHIGQANPIKPRILKIEILDIDRIELPQKDNEKWIDVGRNKELWLRCIFDQKDKHPIINIKLQYFQCDDYLKIPLECDYQPCIIKKKFDNQQSQFMGIQNGTSLYKGNFDLTNILDVENKKNQNYPICDLQMIQAQKPKNQGLKIIIPKEFIPLEFGFGKERDKFLVYKQKISPFKISYMAKVIDQYPIHDIQEQPMVPMIPMFCFPQGIQIVRSQDNPISIQQTSFSFILTSETGQRTYCTCLIFYEQMNDDLIDQMGHIDKKGGFISSPKALCLLSSFCYTQQMKDLLRYIYRCSLSKNMIPLEQTICNIVNKLKFPVGSQDYENVLIKFRLPSQEIDFNANFKYPQLSNESLKCLFCLLDVSRIISIYTAILLEKKIHLISNHISIPALIIEAFQQLLFPFEYTNSLKSYIEAPIPFMIGYSSKNVIDANQHTQLDSIYAYLDTNFVMNIEVIPQLPEKWLKKLQNQLKPIQNYFNEQKARQYLQQVDNAYQIHMHDIDYDPDDEVELQYDLIRNSFLHLTTSILKGYKKYIIKTDQFGDFNNQFDIKNFLLSHKQEKQGSFLQSFMDTRLFQYFIQQRTSLSPNESLYQFFDKCQELKHKHQEINFLKQQKQQIIFNIQLPDDEDYQKIYEYNKFPKLSSELMNVYNQEQEDIKQEQLTEQLPTFQKWSQFLMEVIYRIWFQIYLIKTKNSTDNEKYLHLTLYANKLIEQMQQLDLNVCEKIFRCVLEGCGYFQQDELALQLVTQMKMMKIETSPATHGAYFSALAKSVNTKGIQTQQMQMVQTEKQEIIINTYNSFQYRLTDQCPRCKKQFYFEEILDSFYKNHLSNEIQCRGGCEQIFVPKYFYILQKEQQLEILNPYQLLREIETLIKVKGETYILSELIRKIIQIIVSQHSVIFENVVDQYFQDLEQKVKNFKPLKKKISIIRFISNEIVEFKQKLDRKDDTSSGSNETTKQSEVKGNTASREMKDYFSDYVKNITKDQQKNH
ncbi:hypothetical protein pb186bvf_020317 [Paramecium bursaria]